MTEPYSTFFWYLFVGAVLAGVSFQFDKTCTWDDARRWTWVVWGWPFLAGTLVAVWVQAAMEPDESKEDK